MHEDVVQRIWPGRVVQVSVLGGWTNQNLKVEFDDGEVLVLRIAASNVDLVGIDRSVEREASLGAAAVGVGAEVVTYIEPEGHLVTRFIEGEVVPEERVRESDTIRRLVAALSTVHAGPRLRGRFDSFRLVEEFGSTAVARGGSLPAEYARALQTSRAIENARGPIVEGSCHNDLVNTNFIDDGTRIRIIDWEYAGMGDVFFDLANLAVNHDFDVDMRHELLSAYFGAVNPGDVRTLEMMRFMSLFREAMWGVVQGAVSELDHDFDAYAEEQFARAIAVAAEPEFERALAGAS